MLIKQNYFFGLWGETEEPRESTGQKFKLNTLEGNPVTFLLRGNRYLTSFQPPSFNTFLFLFFENTLDIVSFHSKKPSKMLTRFMTTEILNRIWLGL